MANSVTTVHGSETGVTVVVTLILTLESGSLVGLPFKVMSKICLQAIRGASRVQNRKIRADGRSVVPHATDLRGIDERVQPSRTILNSRSGERRGGQHFVARTGGQRVVAPLECDLCVVGGGGRVMQQDRSALDRTLHPGVPGTFTWPDTTQFTPVPANGFVSPAPYVVL